MTEPTEDSEQAGTGRGSGWQAVRQKLTPAESWVRRRWAVIAAAAAILATTLGVIADLGSLVPGGGRLSAAEAEILAGDIAAQLETQSLTTGNAYGSRDEVAEAALALAQTGNRRIASGLRDFRSGDAAALDDLEAALERHMRRHPEEASRLWAQLGMLTVTLDPGRAEGFYERAIAAEPAHFDAMDGLALVSLRTGDTDRAEALWTEALSRAERDGQDRNVASAEAGLGLVAARRADFDTAERHYQAALDIHDLEGDLRAAARQLGNLGYAAQGRGDTENAERFYARALALMEEDGDALGIALARNNLAGFHRDRGDFAAAEDAYRLSLAGLEAAGDRPRTALVISNLGLLAETRGDRESAMRFYDRALNRAREFHYVRVIEATARRAGWLALEDGEIEQARALADESLSVNETLGDPQSRGDALTLSAAIAMAEGDAARAETEASAAIETARDYPGTGAVQAYLHAILAAAMREQGDRISALMNTTRSRDLYLEAGDALSAAGQTNRLATLSFDRGDAASGCNWLGFARAEYEEAGSAEGVAAMQERRTANGCDARSD